MTWGTCLGRHIKKHWSSKSSNSIGKVYSGTCRFLGYTGAEKDGTVMTLAAYGTPRFLHQYRRILHVEDTPNRISIKVDRSFFDFWSTTKYALPSKKFALAFNIPPRQQGDQLQQVHKDIASSVQRRTEEVVLEVASRIQRITGRKKLVYSGGVALNSVINGILSSGSDFSEFFIQPAANDAGLSLGAAYVLAQEASSKKLPRSMISASLGPSFTADQCEAELKHLNLSTGRANIWRTT